MVFPAPDENGIIDLLPDQLSQTNRHCIRQFNFFHLLYDLAMEYYVRPRIHRADTTRHRQIWHEVLASVGAARILDVACGTGGLIASLNKNNHYTGLDLSYPMLKKAARRARRKGFSHCRLIRANAEEQVFAQGDFDLVVSDTALHMIPDWQAAIAVVARTLTPDGRLVCALPVMGIDSVFDQTWPKHAAKPSFHAIAQQEIQSVCSRYRLEFRPVATNGAMLYFEAFGTGNVQGETCLS